MVSCFLLEDTPWLLEFDHVPFQLTMKCELTSRLFLVFKKLLIRICCLCVNYLDRTSKLLAKQPKLMEQVCAIGVTWHGCVREIKGERKASIIGETKISFLRARHFLYNLSKDINTPRRCCKKSESVTPTTFDCNSSRLCIIFEDRFAASLSWSQIRRRTLHFLSQVSKNIKCIYSFDFSLM